MRHQAVLAALVGLVLTGAASCSKHDAGTSAPDALAPAASARALTTPTTTPYPVALHNLTAQVEDEERRVARGEQDAAYRLLARYLQRARYTGQIADLIRADERSVELLATRGADARMHLMRSTVLSSVHDFAAANAELDVAAAGGIPRDEITSERVAILLAIGQADAARARVEIPANRPPPVLEFVAVIESHRDHEADAERLFEEARTQYRDISPFFVATEDFDRATALELAGDRTDAKAYLEEAATVLPTYAHAVTHLARYEAPAAALARLTTLETTSDDPDVLGAEADALRMLGRAKDAAAMTERARARYEEVEARLPLAYADHAATFYLGMGHDPARALVLAKKNADNRPTPEAVELWLTAAQAAGDHGNLCAAAAKAIALVHPLPGLRERAKAAAKDGACP